ncbi:MAG: FAD-dependent oxidoreductase [Rhodothermales bacterium]|nr:FAD-dependent oxidoreductase [Rhodothermales bacterium]
MRLAFLFVAAVGMVAEVVAPVQARALPPRISPADTTTVFDLVIYGCTSAGIAAAVQGRRMDRSVIVVCPERHLGGLTSSGLGWTDSGVKEAIGGIARGFYRRVKAHYDGPDAWGFQDPASFAGYDTENDAIWMFEPRVAELTFEAIVAEHGIDIRRDAWLDRERGVVKEGATVVSISMLDGATYRGRMFIDATYEGDLMAAAGISYTVGRESNSTYGEMLNGVQTRNAIKHQFDRPVDAYIIPGKPESGLLPRIQGRDPGKEGEGDHRIQAYTYRMCLTNVPENRVPFPKPAGYDPMHYELLARYLDLGWREVFAKFDSIPNNKTDTNNHGAFSTDNIGMNYAYPEASYEERRAILREHIEYQQGLLWFLANDPRVPADVQQAMSVWGLAKDEFVDNGHWPYQIYIREARRMVSDFVATEMHLRSIRATPRPIGMGSYNMDSHNVQRYVDTNGFVRNEGDIQVNPGGPYAISYGAIVPRASEATNVLVPVAVSASHIAYGSIRMEPVFMILGQSAATAAALALEAGVGVQDVRYSVLEARLLADGQVLGLPREN